MHRIAWWRWNNERAAPSKNTTFLCCSASKLQRKPLDREANCPDVPSALGRLCLGRNWVLACRPITFSIKPPVFSCPPPAALSTRGKEPLLRSRWRLHLASRRRNRLLCQKAVYARNLVHGLHWLSKMVLVFCLTIATCTLWMGPFCQPLHSTPLASLGLPREANELSGRQGRGCANRTQQDERSKRARNREH